MAGAAAEAGGLAKVACFFKYLNGLAGPRQRGKVLYALDQVLPLSLVAVLAGAEPLRFSLASVIADWRCCGGFGCSAHSPTNFTTSSHVAHNLIGKAP
jgi:hypothetical protein